MTKYKSHLLLLVAAVLLTLSGCGGDDENVSELDNTLSQLLVEASADGSGKSFFTLPDSDDYRAIPQDNNNPITPAKVELGQLLFHETAIGSKPMLAIGTNSFSCASCHHVAAGFQAGTAQGLGEGGTGFGLIGENRAQRNDYPVDEVDFQPIRSPSAMNGAYQELMLWNGQFGANGDNVGTESQWMPGTPIAVNNEGFDGLETQAIAGLGVHRLDFEGSVMETNATYRELFDRAFAGVPAQNRYSRRNAGLAIAAYERTIMASEAPFQQWLKGSNTAMSDAEKRGAILFFGKADCNSCHTGPALNSMEFYALGMHDLDEGGQRFLGEVEDPVRRGRGGFTGNAIDDYKFKVPQLYNLTDSPFYGHGASFTSVEEVVRYKNAAIIESNRVPQAQLPQDFVPLNLSEEEIGDLVAFLEQSLHDNTLSRYVPASLPSGNCFPNNDEQSRIDLGCQ